MRAVIRETLREALFLWMAWVLAARAHTELNLGSKAMASVIFFSATSLRMDFSTWRMAVFLAKLRALRRRDARACFALARVFGITSQLPVRKGCFQVFFTRKRSLAYRLHVRTPANKHAERWVMVSRQFDYSILLAQFVGMRMMLWLILVGAAMAFCTAGFSESVKSFYDLNTKTLEGDPVSLSVYRGKVALVVNVASRCGFTGQYRDLQALYEEWRDEGFVVLGFPSNDFGGQEPGTPEQIREFCSTRFNVTFPLFEKVKTKGEGQSEVFAFLTRDHPAPKWNFHKYLVSRDGRVVAHFGSMTSPRDKKLLELIKAELAKPYLQ